MNAKLVSRFFVKNYIKLLFAAVSVFSFAACDPLEPATESLYTIHFDLNGVEGVTPDTQIIHEGEFAEHPYVEVDDRGSHGKFAAIEWYQNKDGSGTPFQFAKTPITASYWLYAKWTNDFRTVTFEPNYTGLRPSSRHVGTGKTVEKPADPIRANYLFDGWHKADTSSFDFVNTPIDDDITLYAHWIQAVYTIQFDLNGAEGTAPQDQIIVNTHQKKQGLAIEPAAPTREGFTFIGWVIDKIDPVAFDFANTPIAADTTLYAGWQSEYAFAFKGKEYAAIVDGDAFLLNVGKTYTQINDQKVTLLRVPFGIHTKPTMGSEIQLTKSWGSFEASQSGRQVDYKVKVFLEPSIRAELKAIVDAAMATEGNKVDLNFAETHQITDMNKIFYRTVDFNGDISAWNTSNVTNMNHMFWGAKAFNGDISAWDTSKVTDMGNMFANAVVFNGDISAWDTSKVTDMVYMFSNAVVFNGDISAWDTSKVTNMHAMFAIAKAFNRDISAWNTSRVTDTYAMFLEAHSFAQDINTKSNGDGTKSWDTSNVTDMSAMFSGAMAFNGDISKWDTSNVTNMNQILHRAVNFNGDISAWDTSKVTNMGNMFTDAAVFNGDISKWNTFNVEDMSSMFLGAEAFNGDISAWDTSKVTDMSLMFANTGVFNKDISKWNTSEVRRMVQMFSNAKAFDGDISKWNTSNVWNMDLMFEGAAKFNQDISSWNVDNVTHWKLFANAAVELLKQPAHIPAKFLVEQS